VSLFHLYKNEVYNNAYRMTGNREDAADITQDVFLKMYALKDNNSNIQNIKNWIYIVSRNMCLTKIRNNKKVLKLIDLQDEGALTEQINPNSIKLKRVFNSLEDKYKEALILREYRGFSYNEIAEILNTSVSAVKSLLFRARLNLREAFQKA